MKFSGEAKLLAIMGAIVLAGGGFLLFGPKGAGPEAPITAEPTPTPRPVSVDEFNRMFNDSSHVKGAEDAPLKIIEFADFQCPLCRRTYERVTQHFGHEINARFAYRHYPIDDHMMAIPAAIAVEAANRQGKFWEMYAVLFTDPDANLNLEFIDTAATKVGLDMKRFHKDTEDRTLLDALVRSRKQASDAGVYSTPTFWVLDTRTNKVTVNVGTRIFLANFEGTPGLPTPTPEERTAIKAESGGAR